GGFAGGGGGGFAGRGGGGGGFAGVGGGPRGGGYYGGGGNYGGWHGHHGGWRHGGWGYRPYWGWDAPVYAYPSYGYEEEDCVLRRKRVYTPYGWRVRTYRVCY
ncbi:hypothetical protein, partial [Rhodoblastus acidophilus]